MKRFSIGLIAACLCAMVASTAAAQADLGMRGMGLRVGYVSPENVDGTFGFGVFADMGTIVPNLMIEPGIGFWTSSEDLFGTKVSFRDIAVGGRGKFMFDVQNSSIKPFLGAGLGLHFMHAEVSATGFPSVSDSEVRLGLDIGGGVYFPVNPSWDVLSEVWYGIVSDVNQATVTIGAQYNFGY